MKDIFEENKQGFDSKSRTLTHFVAFEEYMVNKVVSHKTITKSLADSIVQLAIPGVLIHKENQYYDSATVNISVFIEQRNISFQNDISLKNMRLGVLS